MAKPLRARSTNEFLIYLMVTPCQTCGAGPLELVSLDGEPAAQTVRTARVKCRHCRTQRDIEYLAQFEPEDSDSPCISPIGQPSELVDLHQWLAVAYLSLDQVHDCSGVEAHQLQIRAAVCLTEGMKFFESEEDTEPPVEAFFTETTLRAFREHPESFVYQRLLDLLAKLPPPPAWPGTEA
ncbi:MAG: hypothetical protein ACYS8X_06010 [Planctomycetota bacterium]|jgi:hypothetical protein